MKLALLFVFLCFNSFLFGQVTVVTMSYNGGMQYYIEHYSLSVESSYVEVNDHGDIVKNNFNISKTELESLGQMLKDSGFYKIRKIDELDILDASSYSIHVKNYGINFGVYSLDEFSVEHQDYFKSCIRVIKEFCTAKTASE